MKKLFVLLLIFLSFACNTIFSQEKDLGIGVILGDPSGLSAKYWTSDENAIDLGIGYSFMGPGSGVSIHLDYLYHLDDLINSEPRFPIYYGFGLRFRFPSHEPNGFGARGVIGILYYPENLPIDLFAELAPSFRLLPNTAIDLSFGVGARYYIEFNTKN